MKVQQTPLEGLLEILPNIYNDNRGHFVESYQQERFKLSGIEHHFLQDNFSFSNKGVIRGLHFQRIPHQQGKLVMVIKGKVLDVVVDLRSDSPTFGEHAKFILDSENYKTLFVPAGFAHGLMAIEDSLFVYKCTKLYNKSSESGIVWDDQTLNIDWECEKYNIKNPIVSEKDRSLPSFNEIETELIA